MHTNKSNKKALSQCLLEKVSESLVPVESLWGIFNLKAPPVNFH